MSQYSRSFDLDDLDNPHTLAVLCVPPGATVLDLGVASGEPVARELHGQSCQVFGVDIDPDADESIRLKLFDKTLRFFDELINDRRRTSQPDWDYLTEHKQTSAPSKSNTTSTPAAK